MLAGWCSPHPGTTVQVFPFTLVTRMTSVFSAGSATWKTETPVTATPNAAEDATVHVSRVPEGGASVPPARTFVLARFALKSSV